VAAAGTEQPRAHAKGSVPGQGLEHSTHVGTPGPPGTDSAVGHGTSELQEKRDLLESRREPEAGRVGGHLAPGSTRALSGPGRAGAGCTPRLPPPPAAASPRLLQKSAEPRRGSPGAKARAVPRRDCGQRHATQNRRREVSKTRDASCSETPRRREARRGAGQTEPTLARPLCGVNPPRLQSRTRSQEQRSQNFIQETPASGPSAPGRGSPAWGEQDTKGRWPQPCGSPRGSAG